MFSSALFFSAVKLILYLKPLRIFLERAVRARTKVNILAALDKIRPMSFSSLANNVTLMADGIFSMIGGEQILRRRYLLRTGVIGAGVGLFFSVFALSFVSSDLYQLFRLFGKRWCWQFVIGPSVVVGMLLCPVDVSIAHWLSRRATGRGGWQNFGVFLMGVPMAYGLWGVGAGGAMNISLWMSSGMFMPSLIWNRIWVSWMDPITSSATVSVGKLWFSYGLLSASSALATLFASLLFVGCSALKLFPVWLRNRLVSPFFGVLELLAWMEKRGVNYPVGVVIWGTVALLFVFAVILKSIGL